MPSRPARARYSVVYCGGDRDSAGFCWLLFNDDCEEQIREAVKCKIDIGTVTGFMEGSRSDGLAPKSSGWAG